MERRVAHNDQIGGSNPSGGTKTQEERMKDELVDVDDRICAVDTGKAYGLWDGTTYNRRGGKHLVWVPSSLVERDGNVFTMPFWLAKDNGLV